MITHQSKLLFARGWGSNKLVTRNPKDRANKRLCRQGVPLAIFYFCDEGIISYEAQVVSKGF